MYIQCAGLVSALFLFYVIFIRRWLNMPKYKWCQRWAVHHVEQDIEVDHEGKDDSSLSPQLVPARGGFLFKRCALVCDIESDSFTDSSSNTLSHSDSPASSFSFFGGVFSRPWTKYGICFYLRHLPKHYSSCFCFALGFCCPSVMRYAEHNYKSRSMCSLERQVCKNITHGVFLSVCGTTLKAFLTYILPCLNVFFSAHF